MERLLLVPFLVVLNRFRGGGFWADKLPGHPRFYAVPLLGLFIWAFWGPQDAFIVASSYLIWSLMPWGHLIGLGRWDPPRSWSWLESRAMSAAFGNVWLALFFVEVIGMAYAAAVLSPWAAFAAGVFVLCYEAGWALAPKAPIRLAELLVGAVWAALILVALSGCASPKEDYWGSLAGGVKQVQGR